MINIVRCVFVSLLALACSTPLAVAQRVSFVTQAQEHVDEMLVLEDGADIKAVRALYDELMPFANTVASRAGVRQLDAMVRTEGALGTLGLVATARPRSPGEVVGLFREHPEFMDQLGLLVRPEDDAMGVLELAEQLMRQRPDQVDQYPALAAAVCVVHDMQRGAPYAQRVNENTQESGEPLDIFDFFVRNARTMTINPASLPALALVYVVDVTETPQQLQWAHDRYHRNPAIKDRFFEIEYDSLHFQQNQEKRVTREPGEYNIQKILRFGGVCADQAYYAMSVAKACGIPSGYVRARGADVSHAWVGFVEVRGRRMSWNFDAGRYPEYQNLRGNMVNPQTRAFISDGRVGVLGSAMNAKGPQTLASMAAARVARRMHAGLWDLDTETPLDARGNARSPRTNDAGGELGLLKDALTQCAGVPLAWDRVVELAADGGLDQKQLDVWARAVMQLAGRQYQDFAFDFLAELISTEQNHEHQHEMWEWAFGQFRSRPDLASAVRFQQGVMWADEGNPEYAWLAYNDVVSKFINDGPMVVSALSMMGEMLSKEGKGDQIIPVLENAARRVNQPGAMSTQFAKQSNYYRIHELLAEAYEQAGRGGDAARVWQKIGS